MVIVDEETTALEPQSLLALTVICPEPEAPAVTLICGLVVVRLGAEKPGGNVQIYCVAPLTGVILYCSERPGQMAVAPLIPEGAAGVPALTVTARVLAVLDPQLLRATTLIFPLFPVAPEVTFSVGEVVVTLVVPPFHPPGKVQIY